MQRRLRAGPSPPAGGHSSSIICCGTRPASDWRDSSVRQLSDSHSPMVSPHSRLSTGSHGSGVPRNRNSGALNRPRSAIQAFTPRA